MLEAFPFVPLGGRVRIGVAIFSYDGGINFGVTGDLDTARDIDVVCAGIEHGMGQLLDTVPHRDSKSTGKGTRASGRAPRRSRGATESRTQG
jgi:diacylglycerol O-acyltransferase